MLRKMVYSLTPCVVLMRNCIYQKDPTLLDFSYPDLGSPYFLDLSEPYATAILSELSSLVDEEYGRFRFQALAFRESPKGAYAPLQANAAQSGQLLLKSGGGLKIDVARVMIPSSDEYRSKRATLNHHWAIQEEGWCHFNPTHPLI